MARKNHWKEVEKRAANIASVLPLDCSEAQIHSALCASLCAGKIPFSCMVPVSVTSPSGTPLGYKEPDLVVQEANDPFVVELKARHYFTSKDRSQVKGYMEVLGLKRGMLLGFDTTRKGRVAIELVTPDSAVDGGLTRREDRGNPASSKQIEFARKLFFRRWKGYDDFPDDESLTSKTCSQLIDLLQHGSDGEVGDFLNYLEEINEDSEGKKMLAKPKSNPVQDKPRRNRAGQDSAPKAQPQSTPMPHHTPAPVTPPRPLSPCQAVTHSPVTTHQEPAIAEPITPPQIQQGKPLSKIEQARARMAAMQTPNMRSTPNASVPSSPSTDNFFVRLPLEVKEWMDNGFHGPYAGLSTRAACDKILAEIVGEVDPENPDQLQMAKGVESAKWRYIPSAKVSADITSIFGPGRSRKEKAEIGDFIRWCLYSAYLESLDRRSAPWDLRTASDAQSRTDDIPI